MEVANFCATMDTLIDQDVHNHAARLMLGKRKYNHVTPMLVELHCLSAKEKNCLQNIFVRLQLPQPLSPSIMQDFVIPYMKKRLLCSENKNLIEKYPAS